MRKLLSLFISFLLLSFVPLAAFASPAQEAAETQLEVSAPGVFPIVDERATISIAGAVHPTVEDYETNEFTHWYEERPTST